MGWKNNRGTRRNKKKYNSADLYTAQHEYLQSPVDRERETILNLWLQNKITFEECFSGRTLKAIVS